MRLIAAIPNYNHGESLTKLLDQLLEEDLDAIYVLDDASTDNSLDLLKPYEERVEVVVGPYNLGPAGNRNRIIPKLHRGDIIMFVDADTQLITKNIKSIVTELFEANPDVAMFGGGIKDKKDRPMTYNYGIYQKQYRHGIGLFLEKLCDIVKFMPFVRIIRPLAVHFTYNIEISYFEPVERTVDVVAEGHFYVRGDEFRKLDGFNENLRYHEGTEFAYRLRKNGGVVKFTPRIWVKHMEIHSRARLRRKESRKIAKILKEESD